SAASAAWAGSIGVITGAAGAARWRRRIARTSHTTNRRAAIAIATQRHGTRSHHGAASGPWTPRNVVLVARVDKVGSTTSCVVGARPGTGWLPPTSTAW